MSDDRHSSACDARASDFAANDVPAADATATGILLCLRMLAEEAAGLKLTTTCTALWRAIQACEAEHATLNPGGRLH